MHTSLPLLNNFSVGILVSILILGVLIFVHELGHFLAARWRGVLVYEFALGFGPVLFRRGIFTVRAVPFGGFVRMAGEDPESLTGSQAEFLSKPLPDRLAIAFAGPLFNFVLGFLFFLGAAALGVERVPGNKVWKAPEGSGLQRGDQILSVNGKPFEGWESLKPGDTLSVLRARDTVRVVLEKSQGIEPWVPPVIGRLVPGKPAQKSGIREGDTILEVAGRPVGAWQEVVEEVRKHPEEEIVIKVKRGGETLEVIVKPERQKSFEEGREVEIGVIGALAPLEKVSLSPLEALARAFENTLAAAGLIVFFLVKLLSGGVSPGAVGGPIAIGKVLSESWGLGLRELLFTSGLISVNLAVINLIPFPGLDGGHIAVFLAEALARRRLPPKWYLRIQLAGLAILFGLIIVITLWDVKRFLWPF